MNFTQRLTTMVIFLNGFLILSACKEKGQKPEISLHPEYYSAGGASFTTRLVSDSLYIDLEPGYLEGECAEGTLVIRGIVNAEVHPHIFHGHINLTDDVLVPVKIEFDTIAHAADMTFVNEGDEQNFGAHCIIAAWYSGYQEDSVEVESISFDDITRENESGFAPAMWLGNYYLTEKKDPVGIIGDEWWQRLGIDLTTDNEFYITFTGAANANQEDNCDFVTTVAIPENNQLVIPLQRSNGTILMQLRLTGWDKKGNPQVEVSTIKPDDNSKLMYYCRGGATLAGDYSKVETVLPSGSWDYQPVYVVHLEDIIDCDGELPRDLLRKYYSNTWLSSSATGAVVRIESTYLSTANEKLFVIQSGCEWMKKTFRFETNQAGVELDELAVVKRIVDWMSAVESNISTMQDIEGGIKLLTEIQSPEFGRIYEYNTDTEIRDYVTINKPEKLLNGEGVAFEVTFANGPY